MLRPERILGAVAIFLIIEGFLFIPPSLTAVLYGESLTPFLVPLISYLLSGFLLRRSFRGDEEISLKESFLIVSVAWFLFSLLGCVPYLFYGFSFVDALFESVSGFTTTGATIIEDIESQPRSLLFWRSFTQFPGLIQRN